MTLEDNFHVLMSACLMASSLRRAGMYCECQSPQLRYIVLTGLVVPCSSCRMYPEYKKLERFIKSARASLEEVASPEILPFAPAPTQNSDEMIPTSDMTIEMHLPSMEKDSE